MQNYFRDTNTPFLQNLACEQGLYSDALATVKNLQYYDKDGFELTKLEKAIYAINGVEMNDYLHNLCSQLPWIEQISGEDQGLYLDHSMILHRFEFGGEAREWLMRHQASIPQMTKLIKTQPKWGIDFSLDSIVDGDVIEVFHIERDSYSLDQIMEVRENATKLIQDTDWVFIAQQFRRRRNEWQYLEGKAQQDWKAARFGISQAEMICKTF